jgi:diguanylate cyclase (GGDEF)-like protein
MKPAEPASLNPSPKLRHDALTGAFDRGTFDIVLQIEIEQAQQHSQPLSLCVFDLDHFKSINDAYGHLRGDAVLRELVQRVGHLIRGSDRLFRYGGDEFVLLLPATDVHQASLLANRLLEAICTTVLPGTPPLTITASIGVATLPNDGDSAQTLFEVADRRNYFAKRNGRRQVADRDEMGPAPAALAYQRLIERDDAIRNVHNWFNQPVRANACGLRIEGPGGAGHTRILHEIQASAELRGMLCLVLVGDARQQWKPFSAVPAGWFPEMPNSVAHAVQFIQHRLVKQRANGLVILIDQYTALDRTSLELLRQILVQPELQPVQFAYTARPEQRVLPQLRGFEAETIAIQPLTAQGMRIWLRQILRLEVPDDILAWFSATTNGLPAFFQRALDVLVTQQLLVQSASEWSINSSIALPHVMILNDSAIPTVHGLPGTWTDFVGRELETEQIIERLSQCRLLTLLGPGGIGKTRLSAHVAVELAADHSEQVYFVNLSSISESSLVLPAIGAALGIRDDGNEPILKRVQLLLAEQQVALVLDNFEQVIDAAALLAELLSAAPRLRLLVTSREVLNIYGEHIYRVPPLSFPSNDQSIDLSEISSYPAIALFTARAQAVDEQFVLTKHNAAAVVELCNRLDGLPLALELAAARCHSWTPAELVTEFRSRLALVSVGPRDRTERQRTLRGAIEWSYQLLPAAQQRLFRRLGVCVGGCDAELAAVLEHETAQVTLETVASMAQMLDALVDKSLLQRVERDTGTLNNSVRYVMLETIREYALECLAQEAEEQQIRAIHVQYFAELAERAEPELTSATQQYWMQRLEQEQDNLRAAMRWALDQRQGLAIGRLTGALARFWWMRSYLNEARQWFEEALPLIDQQLADHADPWVQRAYALALNGYVAIRWYVGDYQGGIERIIRSIAILRSIEDWHLLAVALNQAGLSYRSAGDFVQAEASFFESIQIRERLGQKRHAAVSMGNLGVTISHQGRAVEAEPYAERSLAILREMGDTWGTAMALVDLSEILLAQGAYQRAGRLLSEILVLGQQLTDQAHILWAMLGFGEVAFYSDDISGSLDFYRNGLRIAAEIGNKEGISSALLGLVRVLLVRKKPDCAARLLGLEQEMRRQIDTPRVIWDQIRFDEIMAGLQEQLSTAELATLFAAGKVLMLSEVGMCLD